MIAKFVTRFDENRSVLRERFRAKFPGSYQDIVKEVIDILSDEEDYSGSPDPNRITEIDHGDYQGTLLYIIGATGYQPYTYWAVKVSYGSCSGCDTLAAIESDCKYDESYTNRIVNDRALDDLMTLALHIVQGLKLIGEES